MSARPAYRVAAQPHGSGTGRGSRVALRQRGVEVTVDQLDDRAARHAAGLRSAGVQTGERVVVAMPNSVRLFEMLIGGARIGAVIVPVNVRLSDQELAEVVHDAAPALVIGDPALLDRVPKTPTEHLRLAVGRGYDEWLQAQRPTDRDFAAAQDVADDADADQVVLQIYTSGTSGRPKGVLITDRNLATKVCGVRERWDMGPDSLSLLATPLFHIGALSWALVGLAAAATTVLADDARPPTLLRHLSEEGVTHAFLVPSMLGSVCREAKAHPRLTFAALQAVVYGGSPISVAERVAATRLFGPVLRQVYGMTETTGGITELEPDASRTEEEPAAGSAGRPYPWVDLEIRDPVTGAPVEPGAVGEVCTRSDQNCRGYHGMPHATRELLRDGGLRTGDLGHLDAAGALHVTGRLSQMIITGGENVHPAEVESALRRIPSVADAVVFAEPDPVWGETVVAVVVLDPLASTRLSPDQIMDASRHELAGYKQPKRVHVVDELPRNASGKIATGFLRERLAVALAGSRVSPGGTP